MNEVRYSVDKLCYLMRASNSVANCFTTLAVLPHTRKSICCRVSCNNACTSATSFCNYRSTCVCILDPALLLQLVQYRQRPVCLLLLYELVELLLLNLPAFLTALPLGLEEGSLIWCLTCFCQLRLVDLLAFR